ncbi:MAG: calcium calmodulin-dependent kinase type 1-like [Trebouxia sp. A1-2]|nr:MAG: calcium calmodulin-dependent kinase type 1-like [Trebouxia sp. A1-2]
MSSTRAAPELHCEGFAVVKKGKDRKTGQSVAIKVVDKSRYATGDNSLQREIQVLCKVQHPNCINLYAVYITPRKVYLVTELVTGGELLDRVTEKGNYSEKDASDLIRQALWHRDLKLLRHMLIGVNKTDKSFIKIADFGFVQEYSPAVDMWSMGVILFILLSGYSPFDDENDAVLFEKIKKGEYDADDPIWDQVSLPAKDLVARLLVVDAKHRLTAKQALQHPWMQGHASSADLPVTRENMREMSERRASMRASFRQAAPADAAAVA